MIVVLNNCVFEKIWSHTNTCIVTYGFYVDNDVRVYIHVCLHSSVQLCVIIQSIYGHINNIEFSCTCARTST